MDGNRFPFVKDLDHVLGRVNIDLLVEQGMRNGIEVLLKFHMVVNIDPGSLAGGIFIGLFGDRVAGWGGRCLQIPAAASGPPPT